MSTNEFEKVEVNDENVGKTANENGVFDFEQYQKKNEGYIHIQNVEERQLTDCIAGILTN